MNVRSLWESMENISDKKKAIFSSTLKLIKDHGFHGAPMSLVAKNAGVAAGTIYHYFESKDQLICELYTYSKARVNEVIDASIAEEATFKETFFKIWTNLYRFYIQNTDILIFFEQFINSPYNINKSPDRFKGQLIAFFEKGIKEGVLKDTKLEVLVVLVLGSISTTAKIHKFGNIPIEPSDLNQIIDILWDGISVN